jgi:L-alanine-DL-glutamate epimerase-like enolase superfamily enzyme
MKVVDVRTVLLSYRYPANQRPAFAGGYSLGKNAALVEITTDEGLTGLGEVGAGAFFAEAVPVVVDRFKAMLVGQDVSDIQRLWDMLFQRTAYWSQRGLGVSVLSGIDTALWDITGKLAGDPVYRLLGAATSPRLKVYASFIPRPIQDLYPDLEQAFAEGFKAVKIKIGPATYPGSAFATLPEPYDLEIDRDLVAHARSAVGPTVDLLADAGQAHSVAPWPVSTARKVARMLEEFSVFWLEEPCGIDRLEDYAALAASVEIQIAAGENSCTRHDVRALLEEHAVDVFQPDVVHIGGITEARRAARQAEQYRVPLAPHVWWTGVGMMANLHFAAATPGVILAEHSRAAFPLREALLVQQPALREGYLTLPDTPGLGVELRPEVEAEYAFVPGSLFLPKHDVTLSEGR